MKKILIAIVVVALGCKADALEAARDARDAVYKAKNAANAAAAVVNDKVTFKAAAAYAAYKAYKAYKATGAINPNDAAHIHAVATYGAAEAALDARTTEHARNAILRATLYAEEAAELSDARVRALEAAREADATPPTRPR